jgi:hypothetical protein
MDTQLVLLRHELSMLGHLDDDAQRDAIVTERYEDRAAARVTSGDIIRMEKQIARLERDRSKLVRKRDKLVRKLAAQ